MDLGISKKLRPLREKVSKMVIEEIAPVEQEYFAEVHKGDRWKFTDRQSDIIEDLKTSAQPTAKMTRSFFRHCSRRT